MGRVNLFSACGLLRDTEVLKVAVVGRAGGGKSAMIGVVFRNRAPHDTHHLQTTQQPYAVEVASTALVRIAVIDVPGGLLERTDEMDPLFFRGIASLVFVVDDFRSSFLSQWVRMAARTREENPECYIYFILNKADALPDFDDARADVASTITSRLSQEGVVGRLQFFSTSIYDHSIFNAWSVIVKRLVPHRQTVEKLLDALITTCGLETAFLIDIRTRLLMAGRLDAAHYVLCAEALALGIEMSDVYGGEGDATKHTRCLVQLSSGECLYLREVGPFLAAACVVKEENFDKQHVVDFNVQVFQRSLVELFRM